MKHMTLAAEKLTLPRLLAAAARDQAVFLTVDGAIRFVLMPADDGDQEVCALRSNAKFMAYLEDCIERAKTEKTYSLEEIKARYGFRGKTRMPKDANGRRGSRRPPKKTAG
jgi:hypothetical protein